MKGRETWGGASGWAFCMPVSVGILGCSIEGGVGWLALGSVLEPQLEV